MSTENNGLSLRSLPEYFSTVCITGARTICACIWEPISGLKEHESGQVRQEEYCYYVCRYIDTYERMKELM